MEMTEKLLFAWSATSGVDLLSRGDAFDARKLEAMEAIFGQAFVSSTGSSDPDGRAAGFLEDAWEQLIDLFQTRAILQGPLADVIPGVIYNFREDRVLLNTDLETFIEAFGALEFDERVAILPFLESVFQEASRELGLFPGQIQLEIAQLQVEFNAEELSFAHARLQFSDAIELQITYPEDGFGGVYVSPTYLPQGAHNVTGTEYDDDIYGGYRSAVLLRGEDGNDRLASVGSGSFLFGGNGDDILSASEDSGGSSINNVTLFGGDGDDDIYAGVSSSNGSVSRNHVIYGGDGDDRIYMPGWSDLLQDSVGYGGSGDDLISISGLRNTAFGDDGNDTLHIGWGTGRQHVLNGGQGDDLYETDYRAEFNFSTVFDEAGNDTIRGRVSHSYIDLGAGNDTVDVNISGNSNSEFATRILTGDGNDTLEIGRRTFSGGISDFSEDVIVDPGAGDDLITIKDVASYRSTGEMVVLSSSGRDTLNVEGSATLRVRPEVGDLETVILGANAVFMLDLSDYLAERDFQTIAFQSHLSGVQIALADGQTIAIEYAPGEIAKSFELRLGEGQMMQLGTNLGDELVGTSLTDRISGLSGDDLIHTFDSDDILIGGAGNDRLDGGLGNDTASYSGFFSDFMIEASVDPSFDLQITDMRANSKEGQDLLRSVERLEFSVTASGSAAWESYSAFYLTNENFSEQTYAFANGVSDTTRRQDGALSERIIVEADGDIRTTRYGEGEIETSFTFEDGSGVRPWESYTQEFAPNGALTALIYDYGSGITDQTRWTDGVRVDRTITEADGDRRISAFNPDGTTASFTFEDGSGLRPWESFRQDFAANGALSALTYDYGSGIFDQTSWVDGVLSDRTITEADGDRRITTYGEYGRKTSFTFEDVSDVRAWESYRQEFAGNGHLTALIYDYGQGVSDTTRWENGVKTERQIVEADGDIQTTTFFSNGYAQTYVFEDISDTRPWKSQTKTFDEAGNLLSTVYEPDDPASSTPTARFVAESTDDLGWLDRNLPDDLLNFWNDHFEWDVA